MVRDLPQALLCYFRHKLDHATYRQLAPEFGISKSEVHYLARGGEGYLRKLSRQPFLLDYLRSITEDAP